MPRNLTACEREDIDHVAQQLGEYVEMCELLEKPFDQWTPKEWDCMVECAITTWMEARDARRTTPARSKKARR